MLVTEQAQEHAQAHSRACSIRHRSPACRRASPAPAAIPPASRSSSIQVRGEPLHLRGVLEAHAGAIPAVRTAVLLRARYDGGPALQDVKEIFVVGSWTDGPSAARLVFGRDGKTLRGASARLDSTSAPAARAARRTRTSYLGKILRLNDDGTTPEDNPFVGRHGYKPEIFALGIRNAIGLTVHPETGEIWETENGPQGGDEVNIIRAGLELRLAHRHLRSRLHQRSRRARSPACRRRAFSRRHRCKGWWSR